MKTHPTPSNQDISITLPLRISFETAAAFLKEKFVGTNISKTDPQGKVINYFKILDLNLAESSAAPYNLELRLKLKTLTVLFHKKDLDMIVQAQLNLDVGTQKLYVESYKINSQGNHWIASSIIKSVLNTFIYKKLIKTLSIDLRPLLAEKIEDLNNKLASKLETTKGISVLGKVENFSIGHFEIKKNKIWVLINTSGWCVIDM
ncbi:DUF4403 family protein [Gelidibacter sp.]|uniref:DUF4403 family protein n=1 Tax=Gelidibacter sp. TaxID=2018083 RepID=UPI002BDD6FB1|nr:DUF4403 family protein [Gelidibacter sp.]HUH28032.1 DUF4403 family protein [Gelidibacter sp.]